MKSMRSSRPIIAVDRLVEYEVNCGVKTYKQPP
jgi:hypothetical protein